MRSIVVPKLLSMLVLSLSVLLPNGFAQNQPSACGGNAFCVETNDFVATITSFRTSMTTNNVKVIDASIRFQNKTNQQLVLAYLMTSGVATDDRGNRLIVGGPNGTHGIGLVAGSNFEPKFVLRPGGAGDAQFELLAQGWPKLVGFTHTLDLTIDEINTYEGNQHTLGGEFPLHFQGLQNGSAGGNTVLGALSSPAGATPCGQPSPAGQAGTTVSNAANAISNLGSLFHKKKAAQNAGQVAAAAGGCDPRVNGVASAAGSLAATAAAQQQTPPPAAQQTTPTQVASLAPGPAAPSEQSANSAQPWTPPAEGKTPASRVGPVTLVASKMPDIIGVHLGMTPQEALAVVRAHYPKNLLTTYNTDMSTFPTPVYQGTIVNPRDNYEDSFNFQTTLPPEKPAVWAVRRITKQMHINRETLFAALRKKYGKESIALSGNSYESSDNDTEVGRLVWLFDESGRNVKMPNTNAAFLFDCARMIPEGPGSAFLLNEAHGDTPGVPSGFCATSYVAVIATFGPSVPIIENVDIVLVDMPLAYRTAHSTAAWYRARAEKARQADLEKSKQAKPAF